MNKTYEDSSESSEDNISDNYDSDEEDFPSEQADDQNIQNHQYNLEHGDDQKAVNQATQNLQSNLESPTIQLGKILKSGVKIQYQLPEENETKEAKALGHAGRATGINKYWVNIQKPDDSMCSINLEQLKQWKEIEDNETVFLLDSNDQIEVSQAKAQELQKWSEHNVYTEVDNKGEDYIPTRWVITE